MTGEYAISFEKQLAEIYETAALSSYIYDAQKKLSPANKQVKNVTKNQDVLIEVLDEYLQTEKRYLLDGHFCLLDSIGQIQPIPLLTFQSIEPKAGIVVWDEVQHIMERLRLRDKKSYDYDLMSRFQDQEIRHAQYICGTLGVPLSVYKLDSKFQEVSAFIGSNMRVLLDTNIIIHREASRVIKKDIGVLFHWFDRLGYEKCIHPLSLAEIQKHQDNNVVLTIEAKIKNYTMLRTEAPEVPEIQSIRNRFDTNENDGNDTSLLKEVFCNRVGLLLIRQ